MRKRSPPVPDYPRFRPIYSADSLEQLILTKGDNNDSDDLMLYGGPRWLERSQIVGKVQG